MHIFNYRCFPRISASRSLANWTWLQAVVRDILYELSLDVHALLWHNHVWVFYQLRPKRQRSLKASPYASTPPTWSELAHRGFPTDSEWAWAVQALCGLNFPTIPLILSSESQPSTCPCNSERGLHLCVLLLPPLFFVPCLHFSDS